MLGVHQLVGSVDCGLRGALRVGDDGDELLAAQDATLGIDLIDHELCGIQHGRHEIGDGPRHVEQQADPHLIVGPCRGHGQGRRRDQAKRQFR